MLAKTQLILASSSPRRIELLSRLTQDFEVVASDVDESVDTPLAPKALVETLALRKARRVFEQRGECVVIGADTVVVLEREVLGKPRDKAEAERMLSRLQGCEHEVYTGIALVSAAKTITNVTCTYVRFAEMSQSEIEAYVQTGEPMDKAGAYGIQGIGGAYITQIQGNYENVMGLPLYHLRVMLRTLGVMTL